MSSQRRPVVIVTEGSSPAPLAWLRERADVREVSTSSPDFNAALADAEGAVVRTYTIVDEALLSRAPKLRVVGRGGVGLDNIDLTACRSRGVKVVHTPDANTRAVAEFVMAQMTRLIRPFPLLRDAGDVAPAAWSAARAVAGAQLDELTLGILGMGRVGRALGRIASVGYGMRVIYHDLLDVAAQLSFDAHAVTFDELLAGADVLSIHVDGRPSNRGLMGASALDGFRGRYLINTSRGLVLDATAVAAALRAGRLDGVALDVYDPEPPTAQFPLLPLAREMGERVLLTPHMASRTRLATEAMSWVVRDVMAALEGGMMDAE